ALPAGRIQGERGRTSGQMRLFAKVLRRGDFLGARIDQALPDRKPLPRVDLRQQRIGVGPVAVFGASNFPLAFSTAGGDTASALAAGCPVVVKAHSGHMATADLVGNAIVRAAEKTGMPKGVFNMIFGSGVGEGLVKLEMSSINPVVLLPGALTARGTAIAGELAASVVMGAGQFCTNPGVVIGIRSPALTAFTEQLIEHMGGQAPQTMLNEGGLRSYSRGVEKLLAHKSVTHLAGKPQEGKQAQAQLFKADVSMLLNGDELLQEEVFGPTTLLIEVADDAELKSALLALRGQLTATLIGETADLQKYQWLVPVLEEKVGRILVNGYPTGVEVSDAMVHGGPYPATSDARGTSVGTLAIDRFLRPVCYQNYPDSLLPAALQNANPLGLKRLVNGEWSTDVIA
ncbi:ketoglutarate semialdehyde dehydrogenase, partial [Pseudomonas sp. NZIPFR-PS5]